MRIRDLVRPAAVVFLVGAGQACSDTEHTPTTVAPSDTADQVMYGLSHVLTVDGIRRARVQADSAYFFEGSQQWELFQLTVTFYDESGEETSTLTADEGTYEWRDGDMQARRNVVGVTPDGRRLTTSVLNYEKTTNQLVGPAPFVFDSPDQHLEGASFTSDPNFTDVRAQDVRGTPGQLETGETR